MKNVIRAKTVLVTGGTGSIGSEIVRQVLNEKAVKVIVFDRDEIKQFHLKRIMDDDRLITIVGDVRDKESLHRVFDAFDVDVVYNAAAMKHVVVCENTPIEAVNTNILGTQNLVGLCLKYGVDKTITISTDKAVNPFNVMGATKLIAERITLNADLLAKNDQVFSCVRFGNVANSRGSVIPVMVDDLLRKKTIKVTNPDVTRFIMSIQDSVSLVLKATGHAVGGEIFVLKMKAFRLKELVDIMVNEVVPSLNIKRDDINVETIGLMPGEKPHEELFGSLELKNVYELDDVYVILPEYRDINKYPGIRKADKIVCSSRDAEKIKSTDLKKSVDEYVQSLLYREC